MCNIKMSHLEAANKANKYIAVRLENVSTKRQLDE